MKNLPNILIVDDEESVRFILAQTLRNEGCLISTAANGAEALNKLAETNYDLLLLDLHMEPVDGLEVLNFVRQQDPNVVVIILTAYSSVESAVEALRLGAFDYLFKPSTPDAIRQRVQAGLKERRRALRQHQMLHHIKTLQDALSTLDDEPSFTVDSSDEEFPLTGSDDRFLRSGRLVIDIHHRTSTFDDRLLDLTTTEFDLLACLVKAAPNPLSALELVKCALGYESEEIEARDIIKWHIHHLRRKIDPDRKSQYIKTVRHKGYMWGG